MFCVFSSSMNVFSFRTVQNTHFVKQNKCIHEAILHMVYFQKIEYVFIVEIIM